MATFGAKPPKLSKFRVDYLGGHDHLPTYLTAEVDGDTVELKRDWLTIGINSGRDSGVVFAVPTQKVHKLTRIDVPADADVTPRTRVEYTQGPELKVDDVAGHAIYVKGDWLTVYVEIPYQHATTRTLLLAVPAQNVKSVYRLDSVKQT